MSFTDPFRSFLFGFLCFFLGCAPSTSLNSHLLFRNYQGILEQNIFVDASFGVEEFAIIEEAVKEWETATNGFVKINLIYPYHFKDRSYKSRDVNVLIKTSAFDSFISSVDAREQFENKDKRIVLGFVKWFDTSDRFFMGIVTDRLVNKVQFKSVVVHEFGHALGMHHVSVKDSIMNEFVYSKYGCLSKDDLRSFGELYKKDLSSLNFCIY